MPPAVPSSTGAGTTFYPPNPKHRWSQPVRAAMVAALGHTHPSSTSQVANEISMGEDGSEAGPSGCAGPSGSAGPSEHPGGKRSRPSDNPSFTQVLGVTRPTSSRPAARPRGLPRFCSFENSPGATVVATDYDGVAGRSVYFNGPSLTQIQLDAVPLYGTDGRGSTGMALNDVIGARQALQDAGVCTICRRGRHPAEFCPHAKPRN